MKAHEPSFVLSCCLSVKKKTITVHLRNNSNTALDSFKLCFGLPTTKIRKLQNAVLVFALSSYGEFKMPRDCLQAQETWTFSFSSDSCTHRSDAPAAPFLVVSLGSPGKSSDLSSDSSDSTDSTDSLSELIKEVVCEDIAMTDAVEEEIKTYQEAYETPPPPKEAPPKEISFAPVPHPNSFLLKHGSVDLSEGLRLEASSEMKQHVHAFYAQMQELSLCQGRTLFSSASNLALQIELTEEASEPTEASSGLTEESEKERYSLDISKTVLRITANSRAAVLRALASLIQLVEKHAGGLSADGQYAGAQYAGSQRTNGLCANSQRTNGQNADELCANSIPCCSIEDEARFAWRGCMLDTVRQFYTVREIQTLLRILALYKMNVFHWHLSDDEAWRMELDSFPELHAWAYRGHKEVLPPFCASGHKRYGGLYSKQDVQEIIRCAEELQIRVVPEFDLPAHCYALKQALPRLQEPGDTGHFESVQGFPDNVLNPALPATYEVIEKIIAELCSQFPDRYFHIGCDERASKVWSESPAAKRLVQDLKLPDTEALMKYFVGRVQKMVEAQNKTCCAWEEAQSCMDGGVLFSWSSDEAGRTAAARGQKVVFCPAQAYYLDMAQSPYPEDYGASWAGYSHVKQSYLFEAVPPHARYEESVLGIQANIWSENFHDKTKLTQLLFPRLVAICERAWTSAEHKDYARFYGNLEQHHRPLMEKLARAMLS